MSKNNNVWSALIRPIVDRPGMPQPTAAPVEAPLGQAMSAELVAQAHAKAAPHDTFAGLTRRQMEVLDLLVQGLRPGQIADELGLSASAVSKHCGDICERLKVHTRAQAVLAWHRHYRILQPDASLGDKDSVLLENLKKALDESHNSRRQAA